MPLGEAMTGGPRGHGADSDCGPCESSGMHLSVCTTVRQNIFAKNVSLKLGPHKILELGLLTVVFKCYQKQRTQSNISVSMLVPACEAGTVPVGYSGYLHVP